MSVLLTVSLSAGLPLSAAVSHVDVVKMRTQNRVNPGDRNINPSLLLADYF